MHSLQLELAEQRGGIQFAESRDFVPDRGVTLKRGNSALYTLTPQPLRRPLASWR